MLKRICVLLFMVTSLNAFGSMCEDIVYTEIDNFEYCDKFLLGSSYGECERYNKENVKCTKDLNSVFRNCSDAGDAVNLVNFVESDTGSKRCRKAKKNVKSCMTREIVDCQAHQLIEIEDNNEDFSENIFDAARDGTERSISSESSQNQSASSQ